MSTIIINDTISISDSIVVKVLNAADVCQTPVNEIETSCLDVYNVAITCAALVVVAFIAAVAVLRWKAAVLAAEKSKREALAAKEKDDCERKMAADIKKREWDVQDAERKQKADYRAKLLAFLEKQMAEADADKKGEIGQRYEDELRKMI